MATLQFTWVPNSATDASDDYYPRAVNVRVKNMDDVIKDITKSGSILKETEVRAVVRRFFQIIAEYLADGFNFISEFFSIRIVLNGVAFDIEAQWDPEQHQKNVSMVAGSLLKEAPQNIGLQLVTSVAERAVIETIFDSGSRTASNKLTPGNTLKITGSQLKIHDHLAGQGLFFVNQADNSEILAELEENFPSHLRAYIPNDLAPGGYTLKIVNTKTYNTTALRTSLSEIVLTVD